MWVIQRKKMFAKDPSLWVEVMTGKNAYGKFLVKADWSPLLSTAMQFHRKQDAGNFMRINGASITVPYEIVEVIP